MSEYLTPTQEKILKALSKNKKSVQSKKLQEKVKVSYPHFINSVNELISMDMVDYETDMSHTGRGRKPYMYQITSAGRKALV